MSFSPLRKSQSESKKARRGTVSLSTPSSPMSKGALRRGRRATRSTVLSTSENFASISRTPPESPQEMPILGKLHTASGTQKFKMRVKSLVETRRLSMPGYLQQNSNSGAKASKQKEQKAIAPMPFISNTTPSKSSGLRSSNTESEALSSSFVSSPKSKNEDEIPLFDDSDSSFSEDNNEKEEEEEEEELVIKLPIYDGQYATITAKNESLEPLDENELIALQSKASQHFDTFFASAEDSSKVFLSKKTQSKSDLGALQQLPQKVLVRIVSHLKPRAWPPLAATCHRLYGLVHAFVHTQYCAKRRISAKTRLPSDVRHWQFSVESCELRTSSLSDFKVMRTLGTGSFGRVKLVQHKETKRFYALKMLKKVMLLEYDQQDRLYWEKDIVSTLDHPNIVRFYRTFQDKAHIYMLFDFASGGELFHLICQYGRLQEKVVKFYAAQVLLVLRYFEDLNIVYRDIKPENLLLDKFGYLQFTDFGFAAILNENSKSKAFLASAEYVSPEMILGKGYGREVDMWSLGILLYELLVGLPPFVGSLEEISRSIFNEKVEFPVKVGGLAKDFVSKLLVLEPKQRLTPKQAMQHEWLADIDWRKLYLRQIEPPYKPQLSSAGDTQHFNVYEEENYLEEVDVNFDEF